MTIHLSVWLKRAGLALLLASLMGCTPDQKVLPDNPYRISEGQRPWILAHGGAKDLFPENTLVAFDGSVEIGIDALEIDVVLTGDEILIPLHDLTIDDTSDGEGEAGRYTYEELQQFNFGYDFEALDGSFPYRDTLVTIPTLEEVILRYPGMHFTLEIKNPGDDGMKAAEKFLALITQTGIEDRVVVASFHDDVLRYFFEISEGNIAISGSQEMVEDLVFSALGAAEWLHRPDAVMVQIPTSGAGINLSSQRVIRSLHRRNMAVQYWTINEKEEMRRLIEAGADGLITDRPDLMREVLEEMGL